MAVGCGGGYWGVVNLFFHEMIIMCFLNIFAEYAARRGDIEFVGAVIKLALQNSLTHNTYRILPPMQMSTNVAWKFGTQVLDLRMEQWVRVEETDGDVKADLFSSREGKMYCREQVNALLLEKAKPLSPDVSAAVWCSYCYEFSSSIPTVGLCIWTCCRRAICAICIRKYFWTFGFVVKCAYCFSTQPRQNGVIASFADVREFVVFGKSFGKYFF